MEKCSCYARLFIFIISIGRFFFSFRFVSFISVQFLFTLCSHTRKHNWITYSQWIWQPKLLHEQNICAFGVDASSINKFEDAFRQDVLGCCCFCHIVVAFFFFSFVSVYTVHSVWMLSETSNQTYMLHCGKCVRQLTFSTRSTHSFRLNGLSEMKTHNS